MLPVQHGLTDRSLRESAGALSRQADTAFRWGSICRVRTTGYHL